MRGSWLVAFVFAVTGILPAAATTSVADRTDHLIERLQSLGVVIDRLDRCGPGAERAAYNMGVNRLCLTHALEHEPRLQLEVLAHEAIHVVQDCLDGLETPSSSTISLMLESKGGFSQKQVDRFLVHHLDQEMAAHVVRVTRTLGPWQRRREVEAYALQGHAVMVESLLRKHC